MKLSISILNAKDKSEIINKLNNIDIDYIHLDVMDGKFVPPKTLSIEEIINLSKLSNNKMDIHLMVNNPIKYIESIKDLNNIEYITIHEELDRDIKEILTKIRSYGIKAGLSIKPNTSIDKLLPYLDYIDLILIMTVEPGYGGQSFIEESIDKVKKVKQLISDRNIKIEVDGGINNNTIKLVDSADIAVVGTYITNSDNIIERINSLLV